MATRASSSNAKKTGVSLLRLRALWVAVVVSLGSFSALAPVFADDGENKALFLTDELDVATVRYELLRRERQELFAVYYLWDGDRIGAAALSSYLQAAKNGARVRIIIDGLSALQSQNLPHALKKLMEPIAPSASISNAMMKALLDAGVEVRIFNPLRASNIMSVLPPALNTRTHEKFTYFGGQKTVVLGDRNWQAVNFRAKKGAPESSYRSAETVFSGSNTDSVAEYMNRLWDDEKLVKKPKLGNVKPTDVLAETNRLRRLQTLVGEWVEKHGKLAESLFAQMKPVRGLKFLHDTPSAKRSLVGVDEELTKLIAEAKTSITFVSPYITFTPRYRKLVRAALARGVKVTILTPSGTVTDAPLASAAFELQSRALIGEGVEIFHHMGPDFLHAKMILVDGMKAGVLTHNFDLLSEYLNYESGILVEDEVFAKDVANWIQYLVDKESIPYERTKLKPSMYCLGLLMKFVAEHPPFRKLRYTH